MVSTSSIVIVGAGIVGLCTAVVARARGHEVTLVARDAAADTASGVAAGMIAPVLESRSDSWQDPGLTRLRRAQGAWLDLLDVWPERLAQALRDQHAHANSHLARSLFVARSYLDEDDDIFFSRAMRDERPDLADPAWLQSLGLAPGYCGQPVVGDWLIDARMALEALQQAFVENGGRLVTGEAYAISRHTVRHLGGDALKADHVVLAAGFDSLAFAEALPVLGRLQPIKGHVLDLSGGAHAGVIRSADGYLAGYGDSAKFGASMEAGKADTRIDAVVVADLEARARAMLPDIDLTRMEPRAGVRASTPDGWPLIGRDATSGVLVATGMRRNGYVFAPLAAQIIVDLIDGHDNPDGHIYRLDRF